MVAKHFLTLPTGVNGNAKYVGGGGWVGLKVKAKYECKLHIGFSRKGGEGGGVKGVQIKRTFCGRG